MKLVAFSGRMGSGKDTAAEVLSNYGYVRIANADYLKRLCQKLFSLTTDALFGPSHLRNAPINLDFDYVHRMVDEYTDELLSLFSNQPDETKKCVIPRLHFVIDHLISPSHNISTRTVLQYVGTEWGRMLYSDVWVDELMRVYAQLQLGGWDYSAQEGLFLDNNSVVLSEQGNSFGACKYTGVVITDVRFINEMQAVRKHGGHVYWIDASKRISPPEHFLTHASEPDFAEVKDFIDELITNNHTRESFISEIANHFSKK
jgi:hypothetical protein